MIRLLWRAAVLACIALLPVLWLLGGAPAAGYLLTMVLVSLLLIWVLMPRGRHRKGTE